MQQGLIPVEVRLGFVAAVGALLVALGVRTRERAAGFGLSLQGAGVAVLYLDVYGGFARYGLVGADVAVVLLAAVAALGLALAVWQEAEPLAVLALLGALAAPALVGDAQDGGTGLLVYLALVQAAVLGLGLVRRWRGVVLVGFLGTLALTTRHVVDAYTTDDYLLAQAFLVVLLAVYLTLGVRLGLASADDGAGRPSSTGVDATLVVGLPVALVVLQARVVEHLGSTAVAASLAGLGAVYLLAALGVGQRVGRRLLVDVLLAVGLTGVAVSVPVGAGGTATGAAWSLGGAGLLWVALRQDRLWLAVSAVALQGVALVVVVSSGALLPLVDGVWRADALVGWPAALAYLASAWLLRDTGRVPGHVRGGVDDVRLVLGSCGQVLLGLGLALWGATASAHVAGLVEHDGRVAALLGALAATGLLALAVGQALRWPALTGSALLVPGLAGLVALRDLSTSVAPYDDGRWLGWLAVLAVSAAAVHVRRDDALRPVSAVLLVATTVLVSAQGLGLAADRAAGGSAALAGVGAVLVVALGAVVLAPARLVSQVERDVSTTWLLSAVLIWLGIGWLSDGSAPPLPHLPLLDPVSLVGVAALVVLLALARRRPAGERDGLTGAVGVLAFVQVTVTVLRGVVATTDAPYRLDALWASSEAQAAVAVAWTVVALVLTVAATRRGDRTTWTVGAALLGVVVAKLFLVDLAQADAFARVVAFIVVGALVTLIGYLAPFPPQRRTAPPAPVPGPAGGGGSWGGPGGGPAGEPDGPRRAAGPRAGRLGGAAVGDAVGPDGPGLTDVAVRGGRAAAGGPVVARSSAQRPTRCRSRSETWVSRRCTAPARSLRTSATSVLTSATSRRTPLTSWRTSEKPSVARRSRAVIRCHESGQPVDDSAGSCPPPHHRAGAAPGGGTAEDDLPAAPTTWG